MTRGTESVRGMDAAADVASATTRDYVTRPGPTMATQERPYV